MNMLYLIPPKSHVIAMDDLYGGTLRIFNHFKDSFQMDITYYDMTELSNFESLFQSNTKVNPISDTHSCVTCGGGGGRWFGSRHLQIQC
jgi:O-acetylhomoserine/O-acetylserine sulfhydrylase-like pyridoxal-dependent enzyme